jgi:hypothetical protein
MKMEKNYQKKRMIDYLIPLPIKILYHIQLYIIKNINF